MKRRDEVVDFNSLDFVSLHGTEGRGFHFPYAFIQQEMKMRNLLIAVCCAALAGGVSVASAQAAGSANQDTIKTHSPMESNAKMKKKHMKKGMTKPDDGMSKDGMKKDTK